MSSHRPPRVLFVCTANVNRSAMAEGWARHFFGQRFVAAEVRSAGVIALDMRGSAEARRTHEGHPFSRAAAFAVEVMRDHGIDLSDHITQRLTAELVDWADAVVVMEPRHADRALELAPHAGAKVLGLWQYIEGADHVWDPQGRTLDDYRASAALLGDAVKAFVADHLAARRRRG